MFPLLFKTSPAIIFRHNNQLDRQQWDSCVKAAPNCTIYAFSFYLDNICPGWSALLAPDYSWVMPLTSKKKIGIRYFCQPPFTQHLGIYCKPQVLAPYPAIIQWLKERCKFWEVNWDATSRHCLHDDGLTFAPATNFVLDLSPGYQAIQRQYAKVLKKNILTAGKHRFIYEPSGEFDKIIDLYRENYGPRVPHVKEGDYNNFKRIAHFAHSNGMLISRQVVNTQKEVQAAIVLLTDFNRLYNIINVTTVAGRKNCANHYLFDSVIREFTGRALFLDFEGSDLPGVKQFYQCYGAVNEEYFAVKFNGLPWPLTLLKS